jgi:hypothetical protein
LAVAAAPTEDIETAATTSAVAIVGLTILLLNAVLCYQKKTKKANYYDVNE